MILVGLLAGCTAEEPVPENVSGASQMPLSEIRTVNEAIEIASTVSHTMLTDGNASGLGRGYGRVVDPATQVYTICNPASRSAEADPLMYVVNYAEDNGFAMVPANRNAPDVVAVTEKGHYNPSDGIEIGGFNEWLEEVTEYLVRLESEEKPVASIPAASGVLRKVVTDTIFNRKVDPRIEVIWGQRKDKFFPDACEGMFFDNNNAGCGNVAIAMVMSYLERPKYLQTTFLPPEGNFELHLNWPQLRRYLSVHDTPPQVFPNVDSSGYAVRTRLAFLLRELAERNKSTYGDSITTVNGQNFSNTLHDLQITSDSNWEYSTTCHDILYHYTGSVLFLSAYQNGFAEGGHIWVCDGMKNFQLRYRTYESTDNGATWDLIDTSYSTYQGYVHYNWGWHGECNGFYLNSSTSAIPGGPESGNTSKFDFKYFRDYILVYGG